MKNDEVIHQNANRIFLFLKKVTNWLFIIFPLPYIFKDISKSINHTEMVQLSSQMLEQYEENEILLINF